MIYNLDYFIDKFEKIPEEMWCIGTPERDGKRCAAGFCGFVFGTGERGASAELLSLHFLLSTLKLTTPDSTRSYSIPFFNTVTMINDGYIFEYPQPTPKQRILAALYDLKANEAVKEAQTIADKVLVPRLPECKIAGYSSYQ